MQVYFAGAESQAHLDLLRSCGVERVGVSVHNLARHTKDYAGWATQSRLGGLDWLVYADSPTTPVAPLLELLSGSAGQPEMVAGPLDWATETWIDGSDIYFLPTWDGHDASMLRHYVEMYDGTVLPDSVVDNATAVRQARAAMGPLSTLGGLTGRSKGIERFDLVISSAWWAVQKHGETQVWTGNRLVRLSSDDKHLKRQRYAEAIEAMGCDVSAVLSDDPKETGRLAILSWLAFERYLGNRLPALSHSGGALTPSSASSVVANGNSNGNGTVVMSGNGVANGTLATRHGTAALLPVMSEEMVEFVAKDENDQDVTVQYPAIASKPDSARQCTTCVLAAACPSYQPGNACAYNIPVVVRTKDQRAAVMRTLVEMQTQRILFAGFSEQVNGSHDVQVGKEMDRLFAMLESWKNIEEVTRKMSIHMEATGPDNDGSMGMISRLFGSQAGANAKVLDVPVLGDQIIEDAEMIPPQD